MFKLLCKIWKFVLKVIKAVVDGVLELVGSVIDALLPLLKQIWDGVFGSDGLGLGKIVLLGLLGYGLWTLLAKDDDDDKKSNNSDRKQNVTIVDTAKRGVAGYYTGGASEVMYA